MKFLNFPTAGLNFTFSKFLEHSAPFDSGTTAVADNTQEIFVVIAICRVSPNHESTSTKNNATALYSIVGKGETTYSFLITPFPDI